ncbi:HdeD family acid-resistance protein [Pseudorhodoplanes sinuspersici]|uniref:Uncharacterized protein n=1 Tax=Pseudorhodoplanes sinuspersici TaxID=1235591 RepID=A0A1W6ZZA2_9HYPH|nr:HdeD family acid-resistance protein [Pseudorhodoplanes sinuspersici]ARQ02598.1 hypothetical protein CAK95_28430 [Pseudorhodoplanes sinuspersici]RKE74456.1 uncharacterized membrane protein HdeD (DUF308 family) [Pseudorhodoplanes sinuspersici]
MTSMHAPTGPASPLNNVLMLRALADNWWLLLLRGIAAIVFGVLAFFWPGITLLTLVLFWGAYALVDGVLALWAALSGRLPSMTSMTVGPRWWLGIVGIAGIAAGILTFAWPGITAVILLMFVAAWAIVTGVMEIWGAVKLRKEIEGEWLLILAGLLSVAFGLILIVQPGAGALALVWLIAWFAVLFGAVNIALAFRLRQHHAPA